MKIYIGPYKNWIGPYQLADLLQKVGVSEDRCAKIGKWLSETWVNTLCAKLDGLKQRRIQIRIHEYDTWNMNDTLAMIILPMLKQLQKTKHGSGFVDDADVPEELRSTSAPAKENDWDTDDNFHLRWDWILDEMIWTFEQLQPDCDWQQQYHTGEADYQFESLDEEYTNPLSGKNEKLSRMIHGPNHTLETDWDGMKAHQSRIDNGLRLFGTYYGNLWD